MKRALLIGSEFAIGDVLGKSMRMNITRTRRQGLPWIEGEPVTLVAMDGSESTRTTDENGEVVIELVAGDASDVARFDVRVRDQEQTVYIQRDDVHGVQKVVFEVGESDPAGNETNESTVAATV